MKAVCARVSAFTQASTLEEGQGSDRFYHEQGCYAINCIPWSSALNLSASILLGDQSATFKLLLANY